MSVSDYTYSVWYDDPGWCHSDAVVGLCRFSFHSKKTCMFGQAEFDHRYKFSCSGLSVSQWCTGVLSRVTSLLSPSDSWNSQYEAQTDVMTDLPTLLHRAKHCSFTITLTIKLLLINLFPTWLKLKFKFINTLMSYVSIHVSTWWHLFSTCC